MTAPHPGQSPGQSPAQSTAQSPAQLPDPEAIAARFTRADGSYLCARWQRPIVPVVFGVAEASLPPIKGAIADLVRLAGHEMAETDPEQGANLMLFFFRDWAELTEVPDLAGLLGLAPEALQALVARLDAAGANQYRRLRFEASGAIRAAFVLLRMDASLAALPAADLALGQAAQVLLAWSEQAFAGGGALVRAGEHLLLDPEILELIRAAYDPVLPPVARDPSHALRLAARITAHRRAAG